MAGRKDSGPIIDDDGSATLGLGDEDRLPWLESADDYGDESEGTLGKTMGFVLLGLALLAVLVGGIYWAQNRSQVSDTGDGSLIAAPAGDYKRAPDDAETREFAGTGDATPQASAGRPQLGTVEGSGARPADSEGVLVQLGAYSTESGASSGWSTIAGKFDYVAAMPKKITQATVEAGTVFRLSVIAPDDAAAQSVCSRLTAAGQPCMVVG